MDVTRHADDGARRVRRHDVRRPAAVHRQAGRVGAGRAGARRPARRPAVPADGVGGEEAAAEEVDVARGVGEDVVVRLEDVLRLAAVGGRPAQCDDRLHRQVVVAVAEVRLKRVRTATGLAMVERYDNAVLENDDTLLTL